MAGKNYMGNGYSKTSDGKGGSYIYNSSSNTKGVSKNHCHIYKDSKTGSYGAVHRGYCQGCNGAPKVSIVSKLFGKK